MNHLRQPMNLRISKGAARNLLGLLILALAVWMIPALSRKVRKVGADGYPLTMEARDPAVVDWFAPDGRSVLFWSREADGTFRFWNRPGSTPDTKVVALPVSRMQRIEWENRVAVRKAELDRHILLATEAESGLMSPLASAVIHTESGFHNAAVRNEAGMPPLPSSSSRALRALPVEVTESAWINRRVYPGMFFQTDAPSGTGIEILSGGQGAFESLGSRPVPFGKGVGTFKTSESGCRIHCRQNQPLEMRYRWIGARR
jgi:hypothetical protein